MFICVHVSVGVCGVQKRVLDPLELELEAVGSCQCGCWEQNSGTRAAALPSLHYQFFSSMEYGLL